MRGLLAALALMLALAACNDKDKTAVVKIDTNPEHTPTMVTRDVQTVISDSGHTRYRITTKLWQMFEESKSPHWVFPNGVQADELDERYRTIASLICDSAYYDQAARRWSAIGHVRLTMRNGDKVLCTRMYYQESTATVECRDRVNITRTGGDFIYTDEMFYDTRQRWTHSDAAFVHIEGQGRVIEGHGYDYYDRESTYRIKNVQGIFPIDDRKFRPGS